MARDLRLRPDRRQAPDPGGPRRGRAPGSDLAAPEELNRRLTDRISRWLFTPSAGCRPEPDRRGPSPGTHSSGRQREDRLAPPSPHGGSPARRVLESLALAPRTYAVLALRSSGDRRGTRSVSAAALAAAGGGRRRDPDPLPDGSDAPPDPARPARLRASPCSTRSAIWTSSGSSSRRPLVLTDSGGDRGGDDRPRRPLPHPSRGDRAADHGQRRHEHRASGLDPEKILEESRRILRGEGKRGQVPALWDGRAAERIVAVLAGALRSPAIPSAAR